MDNGKAEEAGGTRPTMDPELRKTEPVYISLRPWEKRAVDRLAQLTGRARSDLFRTILVKWLHEEIVSRGMEKEVEMPPQLIRDPSV